MTTGHAKSWQQREAHRRAVSSQARRMRREPAGRLPRTVLVLATVLWLVVLGWMAVTLPERVPTHWSGGGTPDAWSSRSVALAVSSAMPLVFAYPLLLLSRLVLVWPEGVNVPRKDWWLATPHRMVRLERLVREDLMLLVSTTVLLLAGLDMLIGVAAHRPSGGVPEWWFPAATGTFLLVTAGIVVRMSLGPRYQPGTDGSGTDGPGNDRPGTG